MNAATINITGTTAVNIESPSTTIDEKTFLEHVHSGVEAGDSQSGGVV